MSNSPDTLVYRVSLHLELLVVAELTFAKRGDFSHFSTCNNGAISAGYGCSGSEEDSAAPAGAAPAQLRRGSSIVTVSGDCRPDPNFPGYYKAISGHDNYRPIIDIEIHP